MPSFRTPASSGVICGLSIVATTLGGWLLTAPTAQAQSAVSATCHYDDPAPYVAKLLDPNADREDPPCAEPVSAAEGPDELLLPMPCGHQMYFRRVDVSVQDVLDYREIYLGDANSADRSTLNKASSIPRTSRLAGAFYREQADAQGLQSYYYIGKYEIVEGQWRLFTEGAFDLDLMEGLDPESAFCRAHMTWLRSDTAGPVNTLPATRVTWFDALAFARAYTRWLVGFDAMLVARESRPLLPWEGGSTGFLRLPTEAEWEYAARGGSAGAGLDSLSRRIYQVVKDDKLVDAELFEVAQIEGLRHGEYANGIGKRMPNRLGLYDMIGNVEELVLDLFEATRPDGLKGQSGGASLRGGSTLTDESVMGVGYRQEAALFGGGGEVRSGAVGARLAISAPFFVSGFDDAKPYADGLANPDLYERIEVALEEVSGSGASAAAIEAQEIDRIINAARDAGLAPDVQALLNEAKVIVERSYAVQFQARREGLINQYVTAASVLLGARRSGNVGYYAMDEVHDLIRQKDRMPPADRQKLEQNAPMFLARVPRFGREVDALFETYAETIARIAQADQKERAFARQEAVKRVEARASEELLELVDLVISHVEEAGAVSGSVGDAMKEKWLHEVDQRRTERQRLLGLIQKALEK